MTPFAGIDTGMVLQQAMKVAALNHTVIANNIANVDTPHYNGASLDFQATLRSAMEGRGRVRLRRTQPRHFDVERFRPDFDGIAFLSKNDYNKVDLDEEIAKLSENTDRYTAYGSLLTKRYQMMKNMLANTR